MVKYKRILLKLSGESLMGEKQYGIDEKHGIAFVHLVSLFMGGSRCAGFSPPAHSAEICGK